MAPTSSLSAPSAPPPLKPAASSAAAHRRPAAIPLASGPTKPLARPSKGLFSCRDGAFRTKAHANEVFGGAAVGAEAKPKAPGPKGKENELEKVKPPPSPPVSQEAISEFIAQVTGLVKLVDSKDIVELQLKQAGCELLIRKREALPQPPAPPVVMMHGPPPPVAMPSYVPPPPPPPPSPTAIVPAAAAALAPAPKAPKSSHPPLKSPMSGTFYRSPGPGLPPFVKPGDKVKKGQVICIIEAMKLMNEIEAEHAGTIVEIVAEDGKPVALDEPLFVIEP